MQAVLVMFRADGERRSFSITRDMTVVGRREDCDLRIPLGDISRKHCRFVRDGDTLRIEDLGSSNGTYHNGIRVDKEAALQPGDSIQVGPVVFVLQIDGYPGDDDLHPVTAEASGMPLYSSGDHGPPPPMNNPHRSPDEIESLPEAEFLHEGEAHSDSETYPEGGLLDAEAIHEGEPLDELEALPEEEFHPDGPESHKVQE